MCTTPLVAFTSAVVTTASSTITNVPDFDSARLLPSTFFTGPFLTSAANTAPDTTWFLSTACRRALSCASACNVAGGRALKASSVGANTVNGPGPLRVSARPASRISFDRVDSCGVAAAVSTRFFGAGVVAQPAASNKAASGAASDMNLFIRVSSERRLTA